MNLNWKTVEVMEREKFCDRILQFIIDRNVKLHLYVRLASPFSRYFYFLQRKEHTLDEFLRFKLS